MKRIVVIGGGFGGVYTARHLGKMLKREGEVEVTLVSRDNYFLMTPLLFEAGSGVLDPRHAVSPIRMMLAKGRFVDATVEGVDFEKKTVFARHTPDDYRFEVPFDHLVIALGAVTNRAMIPGSEHAIGFKTLSDAIFLRNRIIDLLEQADVEEDAARRKKLLSIVLIGGGLVGVELVGELTEFLHNVLRSYPRIPREMVRLVLIEAHPRIMPEMEEKLAAYSTRTLQKRGVEIMTGVRVKRIEAGKVVMPEGSAVESIEAETIILSSGMTANPLAHDFPLEKVKNGRIATERTMLCKGRANVWAIGDCAAIPDKKGGLYPPLAQHALREAKVLAKNIAATVRAERAGGGAKAVLKDFNYETMGMLASLGEFKGVGRVGFVKIRGFLAWWVWRTYYLMQMPGFARKVRVVLDWTMALFFRNDVVKLDLTAEGGIVTDAATIAPAPKGAVQRVD